jgi:hypothetical protein
VTFKPAERKKAKLRLGLAGPAGSGKSYSALQIAFGMGGRVAVIDSENGSADLYAHLGAYDVCTIEAPYSVEKYLGAIREAEAAGYDTIVIDSLSHAWAGDGGLLDQKGAIEKRTGNGWTAWRDVTPWHNKLVEVMLQSRCNIIATLRAKMEYVQQKNEKTGKTTIEKMGMGIIQREGMDYEFTVMFDIDQYHTASSTKDRTGLFNGLYFTPDQAIGAKLKAWLEAGTPFTEPLPRAEFRPAEALAAAAATSQAPVAPLAFPNLDQLELDEEPAAALSAPQRRPEESRCIDLARRLGMELTEFDHWLTSKGKPRLGDMPVDQLGKVGDYLQSALDSQAKSGAA